jgi:UDP-N-acetylmuramyl tripeptide synthase
MESFECSFGRMETLVTNGKTIKIILVKNPTGFNQVLTYLLTETQTAQIAFIINDKLADGTDISWLWDVDFEKLEKIQKNISMFYASGIRAEDMAVRLKYAGIYSDKISLIKDYEQLLSKALDDTQEGKTLYILPTYTAMLDIRKLFNKKYGLKEFWK